MNHVAEEIYRQIGGSRFCFMTGSTPLATSPNSICFKLARNVSQANRMRITLNSLDTYDVSFFSARGAKVTEKEAVAGIYCDQLEDTFRRVTGLFTRLS